MFFLKDAPAAPAPFVPYRRAAKNGGNPARPPPCLCRKVMTAAAKNIQRWYFNRRAAAFPKAAVSQNQERQGGFGGKAGEKTLAIKIGPRTQKVRCAAGAAQKKISDLIFLGVKIVSDRMRSRRISADTGRRFKTHLRDRRGYKGQIFKKVKRKFSKI